MSFFYVFFRYMIFSKDDMSSKDGSQDISKWERTPSIGILSEAGGKLTLKTTGIKINAWKLV